MLLLHTDGLTDTRNRAGKMFGQQRLMAWLRVNSLPGRRAGELRDRLATELNRFRDGATMADDQAFLLLVEETAGAGRAADAHSFAASAFSRARSCFPRAPEAFRR